MKGRLTVVVAGLGVIAAALWLRAPRARLDPRPAPVSAHARARAARLAAKLPRAAGSNSSTSAAEIGASAVVPSRTPTTTKTDRPSVYFNGVAYAAEQPGEPGRRLSDFRASFNNTNGALALIALVRVPDAATRAALARGGVDLLSYVADDGWIARLGELDPSTADADRAWAATNVTFFRALDGDMKIDPALFAPCACDGVPVYVHIASASRAKSARARLRAAGFPRLSLLQGAVGPYLAGQVPADSLHTFAAMAGGDPDVVFVARGHGARLLNVDAMRILQSGSYTGQTPIWARGVYGSNEIIAVLDTGLDVDHCYFRDTNGALPPTNRIDGTNVDLSLRKVVAADFLYAGDDPASPTAWDNESHGTHVAGNALASLITAPLSNNVYNGMAPAALLVVQDAGFTGLDHCADLIGLGCPVTNFLPAMLQAYAQGARLHNNSWGDNEDGVFTNLNAYTEASRDVDAVTWSNRDFLVVCAAGNAGGPFDRVSSPSTAKNGLSVAASGNGAGQENMASFSSRGWTSDGRIKPDLCAPGDSVTAALNDSSITTSNCGTIGGGGTSYSSPLVAGLGALVREYYTVGYEPSGTPVPSNGYSYVSAALVKATLINSCMALSNAVAPPPARDQGWGRPNLSRALAFTNSAQHLRAWDSTWSFAAAPALPFVRYLDIKGSNVPVKVTLVWSDYPATPGASKQLVNDLDLLVRSRTTTFRGNVFSGGWSTNGGVFDRTNNVEQVAWLAPVTGLVEVSVWAHVVPEATQDFALVVSGDFEEVPLARDEDGDGLPDYWERWHFGDLVSASATNDFDGDGVLDGDEYEAGTQPTNALSYLAFGEMQWTEGGAIAMDVPLVPGRLYSIYYGNGPGYGDEPGFVGYSNTSEGSGSHITGSPESNEVFRFIDNFSATNSGGPDVSGARYYRLGVDGAP